jgi:hypothetical protein
MSEHEFEQFLAIFRGMLRLNPRQRDEIAAELRDHLQERLAELTAQGMSREQAAQAALEEFGDAAALAAQFVLVASQQRRRRMMKWTAGSVMAAMVVLYGALAFWPAEPARGPGLPPIVAQDKSAPAETKKKKKESPGRTPSAIVSKADPSAELESRLAEKMAAKFDDVPLEDFLEYLGAAAKVDFHLDKRALDDQGIAVDAVVNVNLKNIRIDKLLDLALGQLDLTWISRDGYVLITTQEVLEQLLETRVYNCRDLVQLAMFGPFPQISGMGGDAYGAMGMGSAGYPGMTGMMGGGGMMPGAGMPGGGMMPGGMGGMPGAGMGMAMGGGADAGMMGMDSGGGASASQMRYLETLIQVVTTTVMPDSWMENGGNGAVSAYHNGLLIVNHHPQAHRKIEQLLRMLREASKDRPGAVVREQ